MAVNKPLFSLIFLCVGAFGYSQTGGSLSALRLEAFHTWSDNISHTSHLPTIKSGQYLTASGAMDYSRQLNPNWLLVATGELAGQQVSKFDALNNLNAAGTLLLRRKFGLGPFAPVVELSSGLSAASFKESGRSGWQFAADGRVSKRLNESLSFAGGIGLTEYYARHAVFDLSNRKAFLEGNWDITDRWRVNAGFSRTWGEYLANASPKIWPLAIGGALGPEIFAHYNTLAWEVSDTYGPGWIAYRNRDTEIDTSWIEISPALSDRLSLFLRYEFVRATNAIGIKYDANLWTSGLNYQF